MRTLTLIGCFLVTTSATAFANEYFQPNFFFQNSTDYQTIYNAVDKSALITQLKNLTGVNPITVDGSQFSISERYSPAGKQNFRNYWKAYFKSLGMQVSEMSFPANYGIGEDQGHNLEAILPGKSADSIVIIVHYDSTGPFGAETKNPGVDDDMTGMAMMLEGARILSQYSGKLEKTVRFVAADYEEWGDLAGARDYAKYIQSLSSQNGFKIVSAVDNEQTGWNCSIDGLCDDNTKGDTFDVFSCSGTNYDYKALGDALEQAATQYSSMHVLRGCMGQNSDHYAMWEIGVPAVVFSEHQPFNNPHFDQSGGDTFDKIDQDYFFNISRIGITFESQLIAIDF